MLLFSHKLTGHTANNVSQRAVVAPFPISAYTLSTHPPQAMTTAIFDFFGLRENPFGISPDPRYLVFNNQARSAWDELLYGIQNRKGLLFFTGEVGTGKTTLLRALLDWLQNR